MLFVLLTLVPPLAAGWFVAGWACPAPHSPSTLLFRLTLSLGLALGFTSGTFFLWLVWGGRTEIGLLLAEVLLFTLLSVALWRLRRRRSLPLSVSTCRCPRWLSLALLLVLGDALAVAGLQGWRSPHGEIDAYAIWNLRARFFHRSGGDWRQAFAPLLPWSHCDYPLLLPANVARGWTYAGSETTAVPLLLALLFAAGTVGLLVSGVALLRTPSQGCLAGIVLLATPHFVEVTTAQYADVPLSFYFLASVLLFEMYDRLDEQRFRLPLLAGLLTGMALWTKNEGQLFLAATLTARAVTALRGGDSWRVRLWEWLAFAAGLAPCVACLTYFKLRLAPANDLVEGQTLAALGQRLGTLERYRVVGEQLGMGLLRLGRGAGAVLPVYALLLGFAPKRPRHSWHAAIVLVVMFVGYMLIYLTTPHDVEWHVISSVDRLLMQLWPMALLLFFLRVATLEERGVQALTICPESPVPHSYPPRR